MARPLGYSILPDLVPLPLIAYKNIYNSLDDDVDTPYLITWNPKPRYYNYDQGGENDFDVQWWTMCETMMKHIRCLDKYAFVPEISEQGKLHMHGFFTIKDKRKYLRGFLPTLRATGFIKVARVKKVQWKTFKYHVKDLKNGITPELMVPAVLTNETYDVLRSFYVKQKSLVPVYGKDEKPKVSVMTYFLTDDEASDLSFSL